MSAPTNEDDRRGELTVYRVVDAPRELVWRAFTEPEHLAAFWGGPGITVPVESVTMDLALAVAYESFYGPLREVYGPPASLDHPLHRERQGFDSPQLHLKRDPSLRVLAFRVWERGNGYNPIILIPNLTHSLVGLVCLPRHLGCPNTRPVPSARDALT